MLLLRLNIGFDTGLPLQEMARTIRYDLAPVPFMLAGALVLLKPTPLRAAIAGARAVDGDADAVLRLLHVADRGAVPAAGVGDAARAADAGGDRGGGFIVVALPYGVYVAANYDDFKGQTRTLEHRIAFSDPDFFVNNVEREPKRFPFSSPDLESVFLQRPSGKLAVLVGLPLAALLAGWQAWRDKSRPHRLLCLSLVLLPLEFAVLDSQKIFFYWIGVMPFLCVGLANLTVVGLRQFTGLSPASLRAPLRHVVPLAAAAWRLRS